MDDAGLYIHIPFCRSKCPYCGFVSSPCRDREPPLSYLEALKKQIADLAEHPWCQERSFVTLFIGGGTPSIYAAAQLAELVQRCLAAFQFVEHPEVSMEANPNTLSAEKLARLREAGINRLSLGVQSFSAPLLALAGRSHSSEEASLAVEWARQAGFDNLNLDFIYGLPRQRLEDLRQTLELAVSHQPEHLALYELTIEPHTPFARLHQEGKLTLPAHDEVAEMEEMAQKILQAAGYGRYEISNYARPGRECRHNINYWQNGSYLGLGAGAVSCFDGLRVRNVSEPSQYMHCLQQGRMPFLEAEALSNEAAFRESVITGLRMLDGVSLTRLWERYGLEPRKYYGKVIARFVEQDMLFFQGDRMRLTEKSLPVANQVLAELV
jgi:oxygen-independent coproporphyrinogen-3 oxidase